MKESRKGKFDVKGDEGIFFGYSCKSKAYRCLNLSTHKVIESAHVKVDEFAERTKEESKREPEDYRRFVSIEHDTVPTTSTNQESSTPESSVTELQEEQTEPVSTGSDEPEPVSTESEEPEPMFTEPDQPVEEQEDNDEIHSKGKEPVLAKYVRRHHSADQIIGDKSEGTMTRSKLKSTCLLADFEPRNVKDALGNDSWIEAMKEEIEQIEKNKTWTLVPRPKDKNVIGTKWVFRNKLNEDGKVSRSKARLVCKGYAQEEGTDY